MSGRSCVEGSVVSVQRVVCAHFVSDDFLADLRRFVTGLGRSSSFVYIDLIGGRRSSFALFGSKVGAKSMNKH